MQKTIWWWDEQACLKAAGVQENRLPWETPENLICQERYLLHVCSEKKKKQIYWFWYIIVILWSNPMAGHHASKTVREMLNWICGIKTRNTCLKKMWFNWKKAYMTNMTKKALQRPICVTNASHNWPRPKYKCFNWMRFVCLGQLKDCIPLKWQQLIKIQTPSSNECSAVVL